MQTLASPEYRKAILDEVLSKDNVDRKKESFKRQDVYNKRQGPYVDEKLEEEGFNSDTVANMRKLKSINIAKRITDKMATIYQVAPERAFTNEVGEKLSEQVEETVAKLYEAAKVNVKLLRANRMAKYQNQCVLQVVPVKRKGIIDIRVFHPHQIDCVPMVDDPESPFAFVISAFDRSESLTLGDAIDQRNIADINDQEKKRRNEMRFVWWSSEHNMITDGYGNIMQEDPADILNPIGELPFIDIADEKENEFWVRKGNAVIDFALDFAVILSDTANTNRLQAYAQMWIKSVEKPKETITGPDRAVWLQLNPNDGATQPEIGFATPNPDMPASLDFLDRIVNFFMTSEGVDPKTVQSKGEGKTFSSGLERMLSMIEQFESSRDDIELYRWVECEVFRLMAKWYNIYAGASDSPLKRELRGSSIPENAYVQVNFHKPEMIQTKADVEASEIKLLEKGLRSKVQALMKIDGVDEEEAINRLKKMQEHEQMFAPKQLEVVQPEMPEDNEAA